VATSSTTTHQAAASPNGDMRARECRKLDSRFPPSPRLRQMGARLRIWRALPRAKALGYYRSPLRGFKSESAASAKGEGKLSTDGLKRRATDLSQGSTESRPTGQQKDAATHTRVLASLPSPSYSESRTSVPISEDENDDEEESISQGRRGRN
jgi:hypothetical protein